MKTTTIKETGRTSFWSKEENANVKKGVYTKIYLGEFEKGQSIGFCVPGHK